VYGDLNAGCILTMNSATHAGNTNLCSGERPFGISVVDILSIPTGTVRVFRQKFTLEDAIGSHACSLEANIHVTNGILLGSSLSYQLTL
jgi:hypothetical protein